MKRLTIISATVLALMSCKKNYTCETTIITDTESWYNEQVFTTEFKGSKQEKQMMEDSGETTDVFGGTVTSSTVCY